MNFLDFIRQFFLRRKLRQIFQRVIGHRPVRPRRKDVAYLTYVQDSVELGPRTYEDNGVAFYLALMESIGAAQARGVSQGTVNEARRLVLPRLLGVIEAAAELKVLSRLVVPRSDGALPS